MFHYRKVIELAEEGHSIRGIAASTGHSRQKIRDVIQFSKEKGITCPLSEEMTDKWLEEFLYPEKMLEGKGRSPIDFEYLHKELSKPHVTLSLLHSEYEITSRSNKQIPFAYRTFCRYYNEYATKFKATLRIRRKPGEIVEFDWCGSTAVIIDRDTGEPLTAYVFVATLPCSQLSYAEAFLSMELSAWIKGHINALAYFGGVPQLFVPDNLKASVTKHTNRELILNTTYREMADYYQAIVMPTRVRKPRDKANVEGAVKTISTWIIAALRYSQCFTLTDLNNEIAQKLEEFNHRPFTRKDGSRFIAFETEEKFALSPLPTTPYKLAQWRTAKVRPDYHIAIDERFYSVPYEYIGKTLDIRLTDSLIECFFKHMRVASHKRLYGKLGDFTTVRDHMPDNHKRFVNQTPEAGLEWAESIGPSTLSVTRFILAHYQAEKLALKAIFSLKSCEKRYTNYEIERACKQAIDITARPSVKSIQTLLKSNKKKDTEQETTQQKEQGDNAYGYTRGATYYGGDDN